MMKNLFLKTVFVLALALTVIFTMSISFADDTDNVVFSVMDENVTLQSGALPLPSTFKTFVAEDNPGFAFLPKNHENYAAMNPELPALCIVGQNSDLDGTVGIDFGRNVSPEVFANGIDNVFLSFYWCNVDKIGDRDLIEVGSVYKDGDKLVRRAPVKLSKYFPVQTSGFQKFEFSMNDLGITSAEDELCGLYFSLTTGRDQLWECVAKIDKLMFVNTVGKDNLSDVQKEDAIYLLKTNAQNKKEKPVTVLETQNYKPMSTLMCKYSLSDNLSYTGYRIHEAYKTSGKSQMILPVNTKNTVRSFFSLGLSGLENYCLKFDIAKCEGYEDMPYLNVGAGFCIKGPTFSNSTALLKYADIEDYIDISDIPMEKTKKNPDGSYVTVSIPLKDIMNKTEVVNINSSFADEITYKNLSCIAFEMEAKGLKQRTPIINVDNICFELQGTPEIDKEYTEGIKWTNNCENYVCYTIVKDGVKICDTTVSEIKNPEPGIYRIYTYMGNGLYSPYTEVKID